MGINVTWDNEAKTAVRYDFMGDWTWSDFEVAVTQAFALTRSVAHRVDSISNFQPGAALPPNALFYFRRAMANAPSNRGTTAIVGATAFITVLVGVFSRAYRQLGERLIVVDSLDEARTVLAMRRQTAPLAE